jgi:ectoine hydroxylase-related dioxygenase (phytanoyl-CoA dioxygenase family)
LPKYPISINLIQLKAQMHIDIRNYNQKEFIGAIKGEGFCIAENVVSKSEVQALRVAAENAIEKEAAYHGNTSYRDYGVIQACPMYGGALLNLLENKTFIEPFNDVMGEGCILYVYITSSMPPGNPNFSSRIHVDRPRVFQDYCECFAGLLLLDDFTEENGGTFYLPGSQFQKEQPNEKYFYANAKRLIAPAGSVFYFNLRLWHAGGMNTTNQWRHALALGMVRPYLKQRFDLPKMLAKHNVDVSQLSDYAKQKLGYFAIPPSTLDEFYGPVEKRTYKEKGEYNRD